MKGKKRAWIIAILLFLFAGPAAAYYTFREDPEISKVKGLFAQARQDGLSREERGKIFQQIGETMEAMGPEKQVQTQNEMFRGRGGEFMAREEKRMDEFLSLSDKERKAKLQADIRDEEKRRAAREKERLAEQAKAAAAGGASQSQGGAGAGGAGGQAGQSGQGGGGPGGGGKGGGGPGGFGGGRSPQQARLQLDYGSSQGRAKRAEMSREKQVARVQMGLPPVAPRTGRGGGGRGPGR